MVIAKLGIIVLSAVCFFGIFVFGPLYDRPGAQLMALVVITAWNTRRFSLGQTISLLKFCLPFVLTLFVFGMVFHFTRLLGREDWIQDTLIKCLVFPSSLIFLKVLLGYISYLDILSLPISMKKRIDLITMKSAFQKGARILGRFSWYLNTYATLKAENRLRSQMKKYACLILALYLYLYEEIENSNRLLKNRYDHFYEANE